MKNNIAEDVILQAALETVAENTIGKTSIRMIADKCGMQKANLLYYFKTKNDLLIALYNKIQALYLKNRQAISEIHSEDNLRSQLNVFFGQKKMLIQNEPVYDRVQLDFWNQSQIDKSFDEVVMEPYALWRKDIKAVIDKYLPDVEEKKKQHAAVLMVSIMIGCSIQCSQTHPEIDLDTYFDESLEIVLQYLGVQET
ncbi:MAG: helix-turn-helix domain-containing protein [Bacillota bacterium]